MSPVVSVRSRKPERLARRAEVWARLHREGVRITTIAHLYGVDRSTVAYWLDKPARREGA